MTAQLPSWITDVFLAFGLTQFALGIILLVSQRNYLKQLLGMKVMLQGIALILISEGWRRDDLFFAQSLVISAFIVEAVVFALALSLLIKLAKKTRVRDLMNIERTKVTAKVGEDDGS